MPQLIRETPDVWRNLVTAFTEADLQDNTHHPTTSPSDALPTPNTPLHWPTVWISDVHLGSRSCRADDLIEFLENLSCDRLYLTGDIVDLVSLRSSFYWPESHSRVVRLLLTMAARGSRVIYIPGNHDHDFRQFVGKRIDRIEIHRQFLHTTSSGKRYLTLHGDEFDTAVKCGPLLHTIGSAGYHLLMNANWSINRIREKLGLPYWSLASSVKERIGSAKRYVSHFEEAVLRTAVDEGVDGIICGHIHRADLKRLDTISYANDGDWVDHCTFLAEEVSGELSLQRWSDVRVKLLAAAASKKTRQPDF